MKKIICIALTFLMVFSASAVFAKEAADFSVLKALNIMVGDETGNMHLESLVTRAEFIKLASEISDYRNAIPLTQKTSPFSDVPFTHWASAYVKAGVERGIVSGYLDSTFRPENPVTYGEAITILLRILGYNDADFGDAYPYGQYALAENIDLLEGIEADLFTAIDRKTAAELLLNALDTKYKNQATTPYSNFNAAKADNLVIFASAKEDPSLALDKVSTSLGIFKFENNIDQFVGHKGDAVIKNNDTILSFTPKHAGNAFAQYVVYSTVSDGVIVYGSGAFSQIHIENNTAAYYNNQLSTFSAIKASLSMGDSISLQKDANGKIEYISINRGNLDGPYIYTGHGALAAIVPDFDQYLIMRKGGTISSDDLDMYDVYYFSKNLKIMMVYNTKVTGVYNSAVPNQEVPVSVDISGKTYEIEGGEAFSALSTAGKYKYGDTVTVLLGKDKKIAGVADLKNTKNVVYITGTGIKSHKSEADNASSQYYVTAVTPDGETIEYKTDTDYKDFKNSVCEITFWGDSAVLRRITQNASSGVSGKLDADAMTLGNFALSKNIQILDVASVDSLAPTLYKTVFLKRLDGVNLSAASVLYYETNEKNAITKLILKNMTGDYYDYGMVTKATADYKQLTGTYQYVIDGVMGSYTTHGKAFTVSKGPALFKKDGSGFASISNLSRLSATIGTVTRQSVTAGGIHYLLAEDVQVYYTNENFDCMRIDFDDVLEGLYRVTGAFYDKQPEYGGRIRILTVTEK